MIRLCLCLTTLTLLFLPAGTALAQAAGTPPEPTAIQNPSQGSNTSTQNSVSKPAPEPSAPGVAESQQKQAGAGNASATESSVAAPNTDFTPAVTGTPQTRILDSTAVGKHTGVTGAPDPLLDTPPPPRGDPTLIGGTALKVDRIRNRLIVEPFGTRRKIPIYVDERSHLFREGVETTIERIRKGDRVYADTVLDGSRVFAKNVRVQETGTPAEVRGQITEYDAQRKLVTMLDGLSQRSVSFQLNDRTKIQNSAGSSGLANGALIDVQFSPEKANRGVAREIRVLAAPGATYTFSGVLTNINLRDGILTVDNRSDGKTYDVDFVPAQQPIANQLRVGSTVTISATFDGAAYRASRISQSPVRAAASDDDGK